MAEEKFADDVDADHRRIVPENKRLHPTVSTAQQLDRAGINEYGHERWLAHAPRKGFLAANSLPGPTQRLTCDPKTADEGWHRVLWGDEPSACSRWRAQWAQDVGDGRRRNFKSDLSWRVFRHPYGSRYRDEVFWVEPAAADEHALAAAKRDFREAQFLEPGMPVQFGQIKEQPLYLHRGAFFE